MMWFLNGCLWLACLSNLVLVFINAKARKRIAEGFQKVLKEQDYIDSKFRALRNREEELTLREARMESRIANLKLFGAAGLAINDDSKPADFIELLLREKEPTQH